MRAPAGRAVILVWAALSVFAARTYPQIGETLSGPDSHETGQGPHGHLLGDWGGVRPYLFERGVRFDLQYISDSLSNIESDRNERFVSWNRVRGTVDIDFGALVGQSGWYFHAIHFRADGICARQFVHRFRVLRSPVYASGGSPRCSHCRVLCEIDGFRRGPRSFLS